MSKENNMIIWNKVEKTTPDQRVKKVGFGADLTSICAYSQIKKATKIWGAMGKGWGYEYEHTYPVSGTVVSHIKLWYMEDGAKYTVPSVGEAKLYKDAQKTKADDDAHKKANTDGITKALSFLGFNADIFTGSFDGNKYMAEKKEIEKKKSAKPVKKEPVAFEAFGEEEQAIIIKWQTYIDGADSMGELIKLAKGDELTNMRKSNNDMYTHIMALFTTKKNNEGWK